MIAHTCACAQRQRVGDGRRPTGARPRADLGRDAARDRCHRAIITRGRRMADRSAVQASRLPSQTRHLLILGMTGALGTSLC